MLSKLRNDTAYCCFLLYTLRSRVLKGKINQAISLRSPEHLADFCDCLSVLDHFATEDGANLYQSVKGIFKKQKPARPKPTKSGPVDMGAA